MVVFECSISYKVNLISYKIILQAPKRELELNSGCSKKSIYLNRFAVAKNKLFREGISEQSESQSTKTNVTGNTKHYFYFF